jgi:hypothetical protein
MTQNQDIDHKNDDNIRNVYNQLCESYRAIDAFRGILLGALPLASGGGIFIIGSATVHPSLYFSIGIFGALVTLGLFIFEIYGTNRCARLIYVGKTLEEERLRVKGQFATRPQGIEGFPLIPGSIAPFVSEPLASGVIYPAVLGAWVFLALHKTSEIVAGVCGILIFAMGFYASYKFNRWLAPNEPTHAGERTPTRPK